MHALWTYGRSRLSRRFSITSLGPNEARVVYDAAVGGIAAVAAASFAFLFAPNTWEPKTVLAVALLPALLVVFNAAFGIYSRLKYARGRIKAGVLLASLACACAVSFAVCRQAMPIAVWGVVAYGPLGAARILLGLPHSRHKTLARVSVNVRGPVLVIGGAGYIGTHAVDLLLREGRAVRVLDRLMYGREPLSEFESNRLFELVEGDVTDIAKLTAAMRNASAVVHLAGLVGDPACAVDRNFTRHTNIIATRMAKDVAQSLGIHRFVFASSCSVYGVSEREAREDGPLRPVSLYAETKIDSERELLYSGRDDFFATVLRFATVFGHSRRPRFDLVANLFTAQAMVDGLITVIGPGQWRPFIHVRDLARAITAVLDADPRVVQSQVFNVGDRRLNTTILELAQTVARAVERRRPVTISVSDNVNDRRNYAVSFEKIQSLLGFEAAHTIEDGVEEMAEHLARGDYSHYREALYSNVAMTTEALRRFQDPVEMSRLYAPLQSKS